MTPNIFLALLLWPRLWRDPVVALRVALVCCAFGATAAAHLGSGSPLMLAVCAMLPVLWLAARSALAEGLQPPPVARTLAALLLWTALLTFFAPRLLAGATEVIGMVNIGIRSTTQRVPLAPQAGNFNQLAYLVFGAVGCLAVAQLLRTRVSLGQAADAFLLVAAVNMVLTLLQAGFLYAGLPNLQEPFMNAGYAIHLGGNIGGLNRLSGAYPEASAYAIFTLALHALCRSLARSGHRPLLASVLANGSLLALLLSTSSTAYVGLALLYAGYAVAGGLRLLSAPRQVQVGRGAALALAAAVVLVAAVLLSPALQDGIAGMAQRTVLGKLDSSSGVERSMWNAQAFTAFTDTFGLGVGAGSTRASSYPLVLLSNLGLVGSGLFLVFLAQTAGRALRDPQGAAARTAAAHGMLATLAAATVSGTVLDLGVMFYVLAGVAAGAMAPQRAPAAVAGHARATSLAGAGDGR